MNAKEVIEKLKEGNKTYLDAIHSEGDISLAIRQDTMENGQHPYAIIVACSDSRVIPESIFSCGIGEIFTVRVAGNVIDDHQLGSIEYAIEHLHTPLVVVLGHTHCGAVHAAITGETEGFIKSITDEIEKAIGNETYDEKASILNVKQSVHHIHHELELTHIDELEKCSVVGALYHIDSGKVEWL